MILSDEAGHSAAVLEQLRDKRSRHVIFVSHCLLNENTRYPGGACQAGCRPDIVQRCLAEELGIVQMPCPEQRAWGGVVKTRLLPVFGLRYRHPFLYTFRRVGLWASLLYIRVVYRRLAEQVAREIEDYIEAGFRVAGVVGVDGSPSCGLHTTLRMPEAVDRLASLRPDELTIGAVNECVRASSTEGVGLFTKALRAALQRRGISVTFSAHDLIAELDSVRSNSIA
jgi:uncharacterized protein YbbK (DUF523 family)